MREICTSGSVRGGDGNIPTYSALHTAERFEEFPECIGIMKRGIPAEEL